MVVEEKSAVELDEEMAKSETKQVEGKEREKVDEQTAIAFIVTLGRALHAYGTPAHRLEDALNQMSKRLGLEGQFLSMPTSILAGFGPLGSQQASLIRVEPGEVDLGKMARLDEVTVQVVHGELSIAEGIRRIDEINADPPIYGPVISVLGYALTSAAVSVFFGGHLREILVSGVIGTLIGVMAELSQRWEALKRIYVPLAAFFASLLAVFAGAVLSPVSVYVPTVAGLIILLPGLTLTIAMTELATLNLVSGGARLTHTMIVFLQMAFGVAAGLRIGELLVGNVAQPTPGILPAWVQWGALFIVSGAFGLLFRVRAKDMGWMVLAAVLAFGSARLGSVWLGVELGAFLGALTAGMGSNVYARVLDRPAAVLIMPGIIMLVPGSIGFRSVSYLIEQDVITGIETAIMMTMIAAAIVSGLLLANRVIPPRKAL